MSRSAQRVFGPYTYTYQGRLVNRYGIARLSTNVIGDVSPAPPGSLNAAGGTVVRESCVDLCSYVGVRMRALVLRTAG